MNYLQILQNKTLDITELQRWLHRWRLMNKKIVFTNGCFDLIHAGHIHLLASARSFGDYLIVGLNTDSSVNKIKQGRPIQNQHDRSLIVASLEVVDAVILFDEETPLDLITLIQPDVLVKGADYKKNEVVGGNIVEAKGGRVELVELLPNHSTSVLMKKIGDT